MCQSKAEGGRRCRGKKGRASLGALGSTGSSAAPDPPALVRRSREAVLREAQKQLGNLMEKYLLAMNMPSRAQMVDMAERLQSIEGHLNEIKMLLQQMSAVNGMTRDSAAAASKPPRTKRPPQPAGDTKQPPGEKK